MVRTIIFSKKYVRVLYMSFHSYRVVFCALLQRDRELPILDPIAWVIAFKLHGEGIRGSQALSIALKGWAQDESFLCGPPRYVEHVWTKIPQFHRSLVGWAGATEPLVIINRRERRCPFQCGNDYYIFKKICQGTLYEFSFLQDSILCPYSNRTENPDFGSCSMSYSL